MIPWDFGLINAFKNQLQMPVFPSDPECAQPPYIVFNFERYWEQNIFSICADFSMKIVDEDKWNNDRFQTAKKIVKITQEKMQLYQGDVDIGYARVKVNSVENAENNLILKLTGIIYLSKMYGDEETEVANG